jgi:peptidyl-prolyl cis-trans isomerase A (cyclophilin A)
VFSKFKRQRKSHQPAARRTRQVSLLEPLEGRQLLSGTLVRLTTNLGNIDMELLDQQTPKTVANFLNYVTQGRYNTTIFHRSVPGFVVQGGGYSPNTIINGQFVGLAQPIPQDAAVENEPHGGNVRGTVALAKVGGSPDSGTSEFFVNLADNTSNLDNQNGGFTVFADVVGNTMPVADNMATLPTYSVQNTPFTDLPLTGFNPTTQIQNNNLVMVSDASVVQATDVKLVSGKSVTFTDADGTTSTLSLTGGSATLHFTGTTIAQGASGKNISVSGAAVSLDSITFTSHTAKATLNVTGKGGNNAVRVGPISWKGGGTLAVNSTGAALAIDTFAVTGSTAATNFTVTRAGNKGTVTVDDIAADKALGTISGPINLDIGLSAGAAVTALKVSSIAFANITAPSIATITSATITGSSLTTTNSFGSITASSITNSRIFSGVGTLSSGSSLPATKTDFIKASAIRTLTARSFTNSFVAASTIGVINLGTVPLNVKKSVFGIGAKKIGTLSYNKVHASNISSAAVVKSKKLSAQNFVVTIV